MYVLHHRRHGNKHVVPVLVAAVLLLAAGWYFGRGLLESETIIGQAPAAVTKTVTDKRGTPKQFTAGNYSFELPADWEPFKLANPISGSQSWQNTAGSKGLRSVIVYQDAAVQDMAFNKILPVVRQDAGLELAGNVSENCLNFVTPESRAAGRQGGRTKATWQGVSFWCDVANPVRNVTAVAAADSPAGSLSLTGPASGTRSILITYTDNGPNPDYTPLITLVRSFKLN